MTQDHEGPTHGDDAPGSEAGGEGRVDASEGPTFDMSTDWPDKDINDLIRDDTRIEIDGRIITKADLIDKE